MEQISLPISVKSFLLSLRRPFEKVQLGLFKQTGNDAGFLRLVSLFRFLILIILTTSTGIFQDQLGLSPSLRGLIPWILWGYYLLIIWLLYLAVFKPALFESQKIIYLQTLVDILVIAFFYGIANDPQSDVFLLYFLPLLTIARFFDFWAILLFLFLTGVATLLTWQHSILADQLQAPVFWLTVPLPRLGFLGLMTVFYLIYRRSKKMVGHLYEGEEELGKKFQSLSTGFFSVDRHLNLVAVNEALRRRHGIKAVGGSCREYFCQSAIGGISPCEDCPLVAALRLSEPIIDARVRFVDRHGMRYPASVSVLPVPDEQGVIVGAAATVKDLSEWEGFEQGLRTFTEDVERTIDTFIQEDRHRAQELTRQLEAILRASAAVLNPDFPLGMDEIVAATAMLLRCQAATVREFDFDPVSGQHSLLLSHAFGLGPQDQARMFSLDPRGSSTVAEAFRTGETRCLEDVQAQTGLLEYQAVARKYNLHALAGIPLCVRGETIGTLSIYRNRKQVFTVEDLQLGQVLANLLAAALANQRLVKGISRDAQVRKQGLDTLNSLSRELVPYEKVQELSQIVANAIQEELNAEASAVFLLQGETLHRVAVAGVEPEWFTDEQYRIGQGLTGLALRPRVGERYGRSIKDNVVDKSDLVIPEHLQQYSQHLATGTVRHLIAVPLNGLEGSFGVLRVVNRLQSPARLHPDGFSEQEEELLNTIACIVAVAMENARRLEDKTFLMEVGQTVTASLSREEVLQRSLDRAVQMLDTEAGFILLPDARTGELVFKVTTGKGAERLKGQALPIHEGVAYTVLQTGQPELLLDRLQDPRFGGPVYQHTGFATRSILSVPIRSHQQVIGVIEVVNKRQRFFTQADLDMLDAISPWTGIAIENAQLYRAEHTRRRLAEVLLETMQILSSSLDLDEILDNILKQLDRVVNYDTASLFLKEGDELVLRAQIDFPEEERLALQGIRLNALSNIPFNRMLESHQPLVVADMFQEHILDPIPGTARIRSWIGAPLLVQDQVIGFLSVDHWEANQYSEEEAVIVMAFAQQAAIAIHNADLYRQQKDRVSFLQALQKSVADISSAAKKEETLDQVAQAVIGLMGCDLAIVGLYDQEEGMISILPEAGYQGISAGQVVQFQFPLDLSEELQFLSLGSCAVADARVNPLLLLGRPVNLPLDVRGLMAAPLYVGERPVGLLLAGSRTPYVFNEDQRAYFSILASHAAIAIRNIELFVNTKRRAQLLDLFHQISIAGQRTSDQEKIINIILTGVTAEYGLRFNRAMLLLYNPERGQMEGFDGIGQTEKLEAQHIWESLNHEEHSLDGYVREVLEKGVRNYTTIHYVARNLKIPVNSESSEVFSQVFITAKPLVVDPTEGNFTINPDFYRLFSPGRFVLVPLTMDARVIGILVADNKFTETPISKSVVDLLVSCASQAAAAVERSGLHQELQKRIEALYHLQEVFRYISDLTPLREVLNRVVVSANKVLAADVSYLVPYDMESQQLLVDLDASAGTKQKFEHARTFSSHGLTTRVLQEQSGLLLINDLTLQPDLISQFAIQEGIRAVAVIRLEFGKDIVGILYVNYRRTHIFKEQEVKVLNMFASQAALAIHNARLLQENEALATQRERDRLREDLHDLLNTFHFKVMLPAELIRDKMMKKRDPRLVEEADQLWRFSRYTYQQLDRILQDMREPVLVERGLPAALEALLNSPSVPHAELDIQDSQRLSADIELVLYRICQEAISNIVKHAQIPAGSAGQVRVSLTHDAEKVHLEIRDSGRGFELVRFESQGRGIGIQAMRNWARKIKAVFSIQTSPGQGTRIIVEVPNQELER